MGCDVKDSIVPDQGERGTVSVGLREVCVKSVETKAPYTFLKVDSLKHIVGMIDVPTCN